MNIEPTKSSSPEPSDQAADGSKPASGEQAKSSNSVDKVELKTPDEDLQQMIKSLEGERPPSRPRLSDQPASRVGSVISPTEPVIKDKEVPAKAAAASAPVAPKVSAGPAAQTESPPEPVKAQKSVPLASLEKVDIDVSPIEQPKDLTTAKPSSSLASPALATPPDEAVSPKEPTSKVAKRQKKKKKSKRGISFGSPGFSRRKTAAIILSLLAVAGLVYGGWTTLKGDSESSDTSIIEPEATNEPAVLAITPDLDLGGLQYSSDKGQSWRDLDETIEVAAGTWLRTVENTTTYSQIVYEDGSQLRLDQDTSVEIGNSSSNLVRIVLRAGRVYARVAPDDARTFVVATDNLQAQAAGTAFTVTSRAGEDQIEVYQGQVEELSTATSVQQGSSLLFDTDKQLASAADLDSEVFKGDEFILWNRDQDLSSNLFKDSLGVLDDIEPPELEITSPVNEAIITAAEGAAGTSIEFTGTSEVNALIEIREGDNVQSVTAGADGNFKAVATSEALPAPGQPIELSYTVTATDKSGNKSLVAIRVILELPEPDEQISLAAITQPGVGVILNWTFSDNYTAADDIRIVWDVTPDPVYPLVASSGVCNQTKGILSPGVGSTAQVCLQDGRSYYFRACRYTAATDSCDLYSNELNITAPLGGTD